MLYESSTWKIHSSPLCKCIYICGKKCQYIYYTYINNIYIYRTWYVHISTFLTWIIRRKTKKSAPIKPAPHHLTSLKRILPSKLRFQALLGCCSPDRGQFGHKATTTQRPLQEGDSNCRWTKIRRLTSWYGKYTYGKYHPIMYRISYMSAGAGFLPSTVPPENRPGPKNWNFSFQPVMFSGLVLGKTSVISPQQRKQFYRKHSLPHVVSMQPYPESSWNFATFVSQNFRQIAPDLIQNLSGKWTALLT